MNYVEMLHKICQIIYIEVLKNKGKSLVKTVSIA